MKNSMGWKVGKYIMSAYKDKKTGKWYCSSITKTGKGNVKGRRSEVLRQNVRHWNGNVSFYKRGKLT